MSEKIFNKSIIYINSSNSIYNNTTDQKFYFDMIDTLKNVVHIKILKSEVLLNPSLTLNNNPIYDTDPIFINVNNYNRISTNINGNNANYFELIQMNLTEKFGINIPNAVISFQNEYKSTSSYTDDINTFVLNPIEPNLKRLDIALYDKNNNILSKNDIKRFNMILCIYHERKKITML